MVGRLANEFVNKGMSIDMVCFAPVNPRELVPWLDSRIKIYNLGVASKIIQAVRLARYLKKATPRSLLCAGHRANLIACWAHRLFGIKAKIFLGVHNTYSMEIKELSCLRRYFRRRSIKKMYPLAHRILCVSKGVADDLAGIMGVDRSQLNVIYNPIVTQDFEQKAALPVEHPWFQKSKQPVIMGAGRLTRQKDFPTLIKAFAIVSSSVPCRLVILGEGDDRLSLQDLIRNLRLDDRVDLSGFVDNLPSYMKRARLFVLSSAWEGFGNVLVEAMSVGTPVVSTDCPNGPREILENGALGALVPTGEPEKLADAILDALRSKPNPDFLRRRAQEFSVEVAAKKHLQLLNEKSSDAKK